MLLFGFKKKNLLFLFHLEKKGLYSSRSDEHNTNNKKPRRMARLFKSVISPPLAAKKTFLFPMEKKQKI
ncbi:MAG TPA: hypothetical protein DD415_04235, partial [Clostridiales bacterium]|nr:hypothetical protein [Clostridiales bacterium]